MKHGVSRQTLVFVAGIVWIIAGINILRIGVLTWLDVSYLSHSYLFRACEAIVIFLLFFNFVFKKLFYKHTRRIEQKQDSNCPFAFFDAKGWIIMVFMITFGILARKFHWLPDTFISVFYVGLSSALVITGILFLVYWWRRRKQTASL